MGILQLETLCKLSPKERHEIIYRSGLNLENVMKETIEPMAAELSQNTRQGVLHYTQKWDNVTPEPLVISKEHLKEAYDKLSKSSPETLDAFEEAASNIRKFHEKQVPADMETEIKQNRLGLKFVPFDSVALYVPGGKALYPSSVLMGVIPAQIAGVGQITIVSPPSPKTGQTPDIVRAVAYLAGANRIVQAGGAQAVLAMAYGIVEDEVQPVDYIYGPGNLYVAAAKNYVFSHNLCGIDSFAGPSEVLIIADESANPHYLAHDLLAQAEHDENAQAILLCTSEKTAKAANEAIEKALDERKERRSITEKSIRQNGKILLVETLDEAIAFSNEYAPEHLEIQTKDDDYVLSQIRAAGSIFVGSYAPVAIGDYYSGTNHILPTNRGARFSSGVSVHSFYRRITWQKISKEGLLASKEPITKMSIEEGLFDEHGYSVLARFEE